ncbi:hypothetical protein SAMN05661096_01543 [Marivirga sericea]|uniref:Uncharacterized protein n=1 Tax=Marivirga sericea TaxID=1028 RepID=A0A1X7JBP8_9BACT|nr:hypothetical protein [Marivirga sericea]SMG25252.1 hypothetical protein SAMN05661096_01543 [Marivirga sericea]
MSLFFIQYCHQGKSQRIEIERMFFKDSKVHVLYNLLDDSLGRAYQVRLYCSKNNYASPLKEVKGAVGIDLYPGGNKELIWDPFAEYGVNFNDKIALEVRGRVYIPFVRLDDFNYESLKRGKEYLLRWSGGSSSTILDIDLYKGDVKIETFPDVANVGSYDLILPKNTKPGEGYRLRISDQENIDDIVFSRVFEVKRKIPLIFQIAPLAIAGGGVYFLITQFTSSSGGGPDEVQPIEDPVNPPN